MSIISVSTNRPLAGAEPSGRPVAIWLLVCCAMIFAMVVIGGITRLTWSGLSITEWRPVMGAVPPLSGADWQAEFAKYQQTSQYRLLNTGMSLGEFKTIFLWEYVHRLWGRLIGFVYLLPFLYFLVRRQIPRRLAWPLAGIFALGAVQGAVGWWMVKSGLADRIEVSQYRLTAHLALALVIYAATLWTALGLFESPSPALREREGPTPLAWEGEGPVARVEGSPPHPALSPHSGGEGRKILCSAIMWPRAAEGVLCLISLTIVAGGFVAGLNAGLTYNTFPLMDGHFVPTGYGQLAPFARNWFENIAAVQFDHRLLAETTVAAVIVLWLIGRRAALPRGPQLALHALLAAALLQVSLGISTLLLVVPVPLAAAHQAGAVLLLTTAIIFRHKLRNVPSAAPLTG
ncbi:MAG TPA: COX15/CtaA family protein [Stellaceae bacterium]|nr:COX15/CtaA family protein [Stellaceae bacterium]